MLMRLSAISSLLLAFAISGCGWFADYELAFVELKDNFTTVKVEVRKKGETKKVEDDADGHDLEITLSAKCGDADAKDLPKKAAEKGEATFDLKDFPGEKGDSCELEATADDAKSVEDTKKRG